MGSTRVVFTATLGELAEVPGTPFSYWTPKALRDLFQIHPPLDCDVAKQQDKLKIADTKVGLQNGDDLRFTRSWFEVPASEIASSREETATAKWVPLAKGGKPFYQDTDYVVNWAYNGREIREYRDPKGRRLSIPRNEAFYFRAALAWADVGGSQRLDLRHLPPGCIFAAESSHVAVPRVPEWTWALLALGSSNLSAVLFRSLDPLEHGRSVGTVAKLPVAPSVLPSNLLATLSHEAVDLLREWSTGDEAGTHAIKPWILQVWDKSQHSSCEETERPTTGHPLSHDFHWSNWESARAIRRLAPAGEHTILALAQTCVERERLLRQRIAQIKREIDDEVYRLYEISDEDRALIEIEIGKPPEAEAEGETEPAAEVELVPQGLMTAEEHIRRLIHYLAHLAIRADSDGILPLFDTYTADGRFDRGLAHRVREQLQGIFGEDTLPSAERDLQSALGKSLDDWLTIDFFDYHVGLHRLRPIVWQITSKNHGEPAFACFVYWHNLDGDTLRKVHEVYLRPVLEGAQREVERLLNDLTKLRAEQAPLRAVRDAERAYQSAEGRHRELQSLAERIQRLLQPQRLDVESRSAWVREKVNEIVARGYRPNRDYGVRVNIEPLKQARILPAAAERVKG